MRRRLDAFRRNPGFGGVHTVDLRERAHRAGNASASARIAYTVCGFAGKNASIASSDNVTSTGVPNTVVVLKKVSSPAAVRSRSGTAMSA